MDAREVVNALFLELVCSPTHQVSLAGDHAHPLLIGRLRTLAGMAAAVDAGTIDVRINNRPWQVTVAIGQGRADLTARPA